MFQKILVPLDGSELAEKILPYVETLAKCTGAEVILFRVPIYAYEGATVTALAGHMPVPIPADREAALREASTYLGHVKKELETRDVPVTTVVKEGAVTGDTIVEYAKENDVDLIAMSTHGRTGLSRALLGSVADQVVRKTGKPILLIHPLGAASD